MRCFDEQLGGPVRLRAGTHRAASLAATWRRFAPVAKRIGISRVAELTGLDAIGVPVYAAVRPMSKSLSTAQGKGTTPLAAKVSALMESIECWHAEERAPDRIATARALGPRAIAIAKALPRVKPVPLDRALPWVRGWPLGGARPVWVPWEAVTLDCVYAGARAPIFDVSSNGLASGNTLAEAVMHGLCEVIERDAEATWRATGADRRVVLETIPDRRVRALIERIAAAGCRLWLWDLTSDVGVPVFGCGIMHDPAIPSWRAVGFYQGFGCHLDPAIAMLRAITEAVQTRMTYIAGARDDFFPIDYRRSIDRALLRRVWKRFAAPADEPVDARAHAAPALDDFGDALALVCERLAAAGAPEVIVVDLRRASFDVPVVKVLVPGRAIRVGEMA